MIISASRRTDIPAFYTKWFINRLKEKFCLVQNPFKRSSFNRVSLDPRDVDVIVFWTRNARPLLTHLPELDRLGYRYYFHYTVTGNPPFLDPCCPGPEEALQTFQKLATDIGTDKVIWRYDPIVLTAETDEKFHREMFEFLASRLRGFTKRVMVSLVQVYRKNRSRLRQAGNRGSILIDLSTKGLENLMQSLSSIAAENSIEIFSCAQENDMSHLGIKTGRCIDPDLIERLFDLHVSRRKDPGQRRACRCAVSRDVGAYDTCIYGCRYCYATTSIERARSRY
ncbi:MAG TPA: DUF1848 domain-containing protein, partial [Desulfobacteraceae bacterium]|nr:DUF1848 domain-containing protein [Desulfobacteraceae bacterium]